MLAFNEDQCFNYARAEVIILDSNVSKTHGRPGLKYRAAEKGDDQWQAVTKGIEEWGVVGLDSSPASEGMLCQ